MDRNNDTKNRRLTSRQMFTVVSFVATLILMIGFLIIGQYYTQVLHRQILENTSASLRVSQNMLDVNLDRNVQIVNVFLSDNEYIYYPEELEENEEVIYQFTRLHRHCQQYISQMEMCDGFFIVDSVNQMSSFLKNEASVEYKGEILKYIEGEDISDQQFWYMIDIQENTCLIYLQKHDGLIMGFWVEADTVKEEVDFGVKDLYGENAQLLIEEKKDDQPDYQEDNSYLNIYQNSQTSILCIHAQIPLSVVYGDISVIRWAILFISLVFVILMSASYLVTSRYILKPIQRMKETMEKIREGDFLARISTKSVNPDFDEVYRTLNGMGEEISRLKINVYEEQIAKQKYELEFLRLQINPHFFLNCLNIIYSLVNGKRYQLIQTMVVRLSDYFRYVFRTTDSLVNVELELKHVENYLQIQEVRYPDRFTYKIRRDTDTADIIIPPLMIQTFVENSIKYAFSRKNGELLKIGIRVQKLENFYKITIRDNGKGFSEEILDVLQCGDSLEDEEGNHIGIHNTIKRLELLYQNRARVQFENDEGALVHIYLPQDLKKNFA